MSTPPPDTELVASKYALVKMIGRGGMGTVWEARHVSLQTRVAIKFIEAEHASSAEARSRFDTEARAAATIQSKHAIQIFDHGVMSDGRPYIVMEYLSGEPLDKRLETRRMLTLLETARILQQVCRGLVRAHERGIIHRDLKPENIYLVRNDDDEEETAKVLDFGIAKIMADGLAISSSTRTGSILGTPYYMSPEQARGLRGIDHRADIWSLGVIAYRCLIGVLPFDGESVGDLLVKICTAPLPIPSQFRPDLPPAFDHWFAKALAREPADRFASATEFADGLAQLAGLSLSRGAASQTNAQAGYGTPPGAPLDPHAWRPADRPYAGAYGTPNGTAPIAASMPYPARAPSGSTGTPLPYGTPGYGHGQAPFPQSPHATGRTAAGLSTSLPGERRSNTGLIFTAVGAGFLFLGAIGAMAWRFAMPRDLPTRPIATQNAASTPLAIGTASVTAEARAMSALTIQDEPVATAKTSANSHSVAPAMSMSGKLTKPVLGAPPAKPTPLSATNSNAGTKSVAAIQPATIQPATINGNKPNPSGF